MRFARDKDTGQFFTVCPKCGFVMVGYGLGRTPCLPCLNEFLKAQGVPFPEYAKEEESSK